MFDYIPSPSTLYSTLQVCNQLFCNVSTHLLHYMVTHSKGMWSCHYSTTAEKYRPQSCHFTSLSCSLFFCVTQTVTCTVNSTTVYVFQPECALETCVHMHASVSIRTDSNINVDTVSYQMRNRTGTALILHQCLPDAAQDHRLASCPTPPS